MYQPPRRQTACGFSCLTRGGCHLESVKKLMSTDHWTLCCLLLCPFLAKIFFPAVCVVIYMHVACVHITCMVLLGGGGHLSCERTSFDRFYSDGCRLMVLTCAQHSPKCSGCIDSDALHNSTGRCDSHPFLWVEKLGYRNIKSLA